MPLPPGGPPVDQRFGGERRIRRRADYQQVYSRGRRINGRYLTVFGLPRGDSAARLGIAATRKLGSAVERNLAKRLIREMFRRNPAPVGFDVVVVPRRTLFDAPFSAVEADYTASLRRLRTGAGAR